MAGVPASTYQQFWTDMRTSLTIESKGLINKYPDVALSVHQLLKVLCDIENLASNTPVSVGESEEWADVISSAEDNRETYCKALRGKPQYGSYTVTLMILMGSLRIAPRWKKASRKSADGRGATPRKQPALRRKQQYQCHLQK
jgi:hypothetical protein